ncbi:MAG: hypothetical protein R2749_12045 [Acidimicrobiales bacterium]
MEPADDEHDPDGTTAYERAQINSLARITRARLAEVDAAIDAATDSTGRPGFGTCGTLRDADRRGAAAFGPPGHHLLRALRR